MVVKSPLLSYLEGIDMYRLSSGADKVTCDAGLLQSYDNIDYQIYTIHNYSEEKCFASQTEEGKCF